MTVKWNAKAADVKLDPKVARALLDGGQRVAVDAAILAPKDTGRGAKTIRADLVMVDGEPEVHVGWDTSAFYLQWAEFGSEHQRATPFLRAAAARYQ